MYSPDEEDEDDGQEESVSSVSKDQLPQFGRI